MNDDVLDTDFLIAQGAENLQPQRVRHRLQGSRSPFDVGVVCE